MISRVLQKSPLKTCLQNLIFASGLLFSHILLAEELPAYGLTEGHMPALSEEIGEKDIFEVQPTGIQTEQPLNTEMAETSTVQMPEIVESKEHSATTTPIAEPTTVEQPDKETEDANQTNPENPENPESPENPENTKPVPKKKKVLAPNVELKAVAPLLLPNQIAPDDAFDPNSNLISCPAPTPPQTKDSPQTSSVEEGFVILGSEIMPGTSTRLAWSPGVSISGLEVPTPVLILNGVNPGPVVCLTAAIHGDEINGIEIVRRVIYDVDPKKLSGKIIGVPIVNLQGFQRGSRYLPDRRDLNRYFPGSPSGSLASRVAYSLFSEVINHCDMLIDFHTGSLRRSNLPQIRADMKNPSVAKFTEGFDDMVVVHSPGDQGMLRNAATANGIPAVTFEVGESLRLQTSHVEMGVKSVFSLLSREGMYPRAFSWGSGEPVYYKSIWLRANQGGILINQVKLGDKVAKGTTLGTVTDPITNEKSEINSTVRGKIIGMAVNQVVMDGYAAFHIGIEASEEDMIQSAKQQPTPEVEAEYINEEIEPEDE